LLPLVSCPGGRPITGRCLTKAKLLGTSSLH
jgi:hypothetical protein